MKRRHRTAPRVKTPTAAAARAGPVEESGGNTPVSCGHERIPAEWAWHYRTLLHLRERLLRAHGERAAQAAAPADAVAGRAGEQADRDGRWAELGHETDRLFEVDCALQRIRDGTYGFCEATGRPIAAERLRAAPWTRYALAAPPIEEPPAPEEPPP